jgi:tetratricopeptide (TPR) repeat protein
MTSKRQIRVFIASPGDLPVERKAFREQVDYLNIGFGDGADVEFIPLGWEDTLATTGRRSQSVINQEIDGCDVFILTMHRHWGQEAPDSEYSSYTEEEFHRALERFKKGGSPEIFVFFKGIESASLADPGPQLQKVIDFKLELEETRSIMYKQFNDNSGFETLISDHLRAYAKGELSPLDLDAFKTPLPLEARQELEESREKLLQAEIKIKSEIARADESSQQALLVEELALELAMTASDLALEGRIEHAKIKFAKATQGSNAVIVLTLAAQFYCRIGALSEAEELLNKGMANVVGDESSGIFNSLGFIYTTRGKLDQAEQMYRKALVINEKIGRQKGMAILYGNLGNIYSIRGEMDQAEQIYCDALAIYEKLNDQEGISTMYGNLGIIYSTRGDMDQAEQMYRKALAIDEKLGLQEGMANQYGNLGIIFDERGDQAQAEQMYNKSLAVNEKLGRLEGMAIQYINLGVLYIRHGDLDQAEKMYQKALLIEEKLGRVEGMGSVYCNLGHLHKQRGNLDQAEQMYRKALTYAETLGAKHQINKLHKFLQELLDSEYI